MMNSVLARLRPIAPQLQLSEADVLRVYILESLLERLTKVYVRYPNVIVRGSLVTRSWIQPRYFRQVQDLDLMMDAAFEEEKGKRVVAEMIGLEMGDGLVFPEGYRVSRIWEETELPALRFALPVVVEKEMQEIQLDFSFNDPLVPPAVFQSYTTILGDAFDILTISPELACAWKLHGLFEFWDQGYRWQAKTLYDIFVIMDTQPLDEQLLKEGIRVAFQDRKTPFWVYTRILEGRFGTSKGSQKGWQKWLEQHDGRINFPTFTPLLTHIRSTVDAIFLALMEEEKGSD